jgi:hypothetical protein
MTTSKMRINFTTGELEINLTEKSADLRLNDISIVSNPEKPAGGPSIWDAEDEIDNFGFLFSI